jgi:hypothetical protein
MKKSVIVILSCLMFSFCSQTPQNNTDSNKTQENYKVQKDTIIKDSELKKHISEIEQQNQLEQHLQGEWTLQKVIITEFGKKQDFTGRFVNQSFIKLNPKSDCQGELLLAENEIVMNFIGSWYLNGEGKKINIQGTTKKMVEGTVQSARIGIEAIIKSIEGGYINLDISKLNLDYEDLLNNNVNMEAVLKKN